MYVVGANTMPSDLNFMRIHLLIPKASNLRTNDAVSIGKSMPSRFNFSHLGPLCNVKRTTWSVKSAADGSSLNSPPTNDSTGGTRLVRTIQSFQSKVVARLNALRKNLPAKLFSFLVGFYCATAFATVIGQTGDWDVLSAALTVAVVEGIGALMYNASLTLADNVRYLIVIFNYWKAGLSLGLFLDSFKF